jgi:hypothetical protein
MNMTIKRLFERLETAIGKPDDLRCLSDEELAAMLDFCKAVIDTPYRLGEIEASLQERGLGHLRELAATLLNRGGLE